jgi:hypothetical protein
VLDSSGSISSDDYIRQKEVVKYLSNYFVLNGLNYRTGLIQFSENADLVVRLSDPSSQFNTSIDNMIQMGTITRLDRALRLAQTGLFNTLNGDRTNVGDVLYVVVDGTQTPQADSEEPADILDEMRAVGTDVVVVGIGNEITNFELKQLAGGRDDRVFEAPTFDDFVNEAFARDLINVLCDTRVHGGYTQWTAWSTCTATCGGGSHTRTRSCTNPTPDVDGRSCIDQGLGPAFETESCNNNICPG